MIKLGIDIGGTKMAAGVVDDDGRILARARRATPTSDPAAIDQAIADLYLELSSYGTIQHVGLAAAGFVSSDRSTVLTAPNLPWHNYPLAERVAALLPAGCVVVVENDANAAAWGEHLYGPVGGTSTSLMITLGTGIGGGIVSGGSLMRGAFGAAGEVGHFTVVQDGLSCGCGNLGCWEAYASGTALVENARRAIRARPEEATALLRFTEGKDHSLTGRNIADAALSGDPLCLELFDTLGDWIGRGLASIASILDPEVIIIGGGVAESKGLFLQRIGDVFQSHLSSRDQRPQAQIFAASLGNDAGLVGVAALASEEMLLQSAPA